MNFYETMYIVHPALQAGRLEDIVDNINTRIDALKGNMPIYKYVGNIALSKYFNIFFNTKFTDCHTFYWFYNLYIYQIM